MLTSILDFVSPRACRICGKRLSTVEQEICTVCNRHLPRTHYAETPYDNEMARRFWGRFHTERAAALFFYEAHNAPSRLIHDLKYHGKEALGEWLGRVAAEEFAPEGFFEGIDMIVPVPITWRRKWRRGYNQSTAIARGVAQVTGLTVAAKALKRTHFTRSQTQLSVSERMANVVGAFRLRRPDGIAGRHILLVDDIVTTGATASECAKELEKAGAAGISVLSIGCTK
jgi:ComF family protein